MISSINQLIRKIKDPIKEIKTIREGVSPRIIECFLVEKSFAINDILPRLNISKSTYFSKKKTDKLLDSSSTEKFLRFISVVQMSLEVLGEKEGKNWLYRKIPSLQDQVPLDLLDTEAGHKLVEEVLLQIKYGIYS